MANGNGLEEWRTIPSFNNLYEVSNYGRVRSWLNSGNTKLQLTEPRYLSQQQDKKGYIVYFLMKEGKQRSFRAHRLVLHAFVGPSDLQVNHKNGNRSDNYIDNLEYCTGSENMTHAYTVLKRQVLQGKNNGNTKFSEAQVAQIRDLAAKGMTPPAIARITGISRPYVQSIVSGKRRGVQK